MVSVTVCVVAPATAKEIVRVIVMPKVIPLVKTY